MAFTTKTKEANLVIGILGWFDGLVLWAGMSLGTVPETAINMLGSEISIAVGVLGFLRWAYLKYKR